MKDELKISLTAPDSLRVDTQGAEPLSLRLGNAVSGTSDYNRLRNKPVINDVELIGSLTSQSLHIVSENTVDGWAENPSYIPKRGEIVIYTDYGIGKTGEPIPAIKVGDGSAYAADLPFIGEDQRQELLEHINDTTVHVTDAERAFWNNKLNYDVEGEELLFNRN